MDINSSSLFSLAIGNAANASAFDICWGADEVVGLGLAAAAVAMATTATAAVAVATGCAVFGGW